MKALLPRYNDDEISKVCYGCAKYEKIKEEILAKEELLDEQHCLQNS
ncbi:MAG: hypothetical protein AB1608_01365 [Thermoproteota archaeon]